MMKAIKVLMMIMMIISDDDDNDCDYDSDYFGYNNLS